MTREEAEQRIAGSEQKIIELETKVDRLERIAIALADATAGFQGRAAMTDGRVFVDQVWKDLVTSTAKILRRSH